jgi:hypothetical protein
VAAFPVERSLSLRLVFRARFNFLVESPSERSRELLLLRVRVIIATLKKTAAPKPDRRIGVNAAAARTLQPLAGMPAGPLTDVASSGQAAEAWVP